MTLVLLIELYFISLLGRFFLNWMPWDSYIRSFRQKCLLMNGAELIMQSLMPNLVLLVHEMFMYLVKGDFFLLF